MGGERGPHIVEDSGGTRPFSCLEERLRPSQVVDRARSGNLLHNVRNHLKRFIRPSQSRQQPPAVAVAPVDLLRPAPFADFLQEFRITSSQATLSFELELDATGFESPTPDRFSYLLLDMNFDPIVTGGPTGAEFLAFDFVPGTTAPDRFGAATGLLPAPNITPVPEPATMLGLFAGLAILRRRR
jgi:hypothetical protein